MIALIGALLGLVTSALPKAIQYFQTKTDNKHELAVMDKQIERDKFQHEYKIEEINVTADIEESKALEKRAQVTITGVKWIDSLLALLNGLVRPTVTYYFILLYGAVKGAMFYIALDAMDPAQAILSIWQPEDKALLAMVLAYWFGQRAMKYAMERWVPRPA